MKTDKVISDIASALGIIGFLGSIASGFFGNTVATIILVALMILSWLIWLSVRVVALSSQVQKLSGGVPNTKENTTPAGFQIEKHLEHAPLITCKGQQHEKINADFLDFDECTLLINVWVPNQNMGIRKTKKVERYIFGHHETKDGKEVNKFGLRYSTTKKWEVLFSNGVDNSCCISRGDGLQSGWHQFMITWDKSKPQLDFLIDQGSRETSASFLENWPEHLEETVCVGAWKSSDDDSFAETKLADLWIIDKYLKASSALVKEHRQLRTTI